jgi:hypothetical protein
MQGQFVLPLEALVVSIHALAALQRRHVASGRAGGRGWGYDLGERATSLGNSSAAA